MLDKNEIPAFMQPYRNGPVAVLGAGVSGHGARALLDALGIPVTVFDQRAGDDARADFGLEQARNHPLLVFSPAFSASHPWMQTAREAGCRLISEVDFGGLFWPGPLLAVTGTNGKTTLVDFLTYALKRSGEDAIAAGNIGYPVSRLFETQPSSRSMAVCEISSFQAESLAHLRPRHVLWTTIDEDHLDRHGSMEAYFRAKWRLVERLQAGGMLFCGPSVRAMARQFGLRPPSAAGIVEVLDQGVDPPETSWLAQHPQRDNYRLAAAYWCHTGRCPAVLEQAAGQFKAPPHRLSKIAEVGQAEFWNDSKATNFSAVLAALENFHKPVLWIGGGLSKGGDLAGFAHALAAKVRAAFVIGQSAPELRRLLVAKGVTVSVCQDLEQAVTTAYERIVEPAVILLSPGFASLDQFRDYTERGMCFERVVFSLKQHALCPSNPSCTQLSKESS